MRIDVVTILPGIVEGAISEGLVARAKDAGIVAVSTVSPRSFTEDRHRTVDDAPFGGGAGMVMKPQPVVEAVESLPATDGRRVIVFSAGGVPLSQAWLQDAARCPHLILVCGRYEGMDARVGRELGAEELSLGDYVLAGGEVAAAVVLEGVVRLLPGAVGDPGSLHEESFSVGPGLLEYPHYTRPPEFRGHRVPEVLLSGNHTQVARWRRFQALRRTRRSRPDLFARLKLSPEDRALVESGEFEEE